MLLIIEALLLISAALGKDHRAAVKGQIFPLDMALNSVDDLYYGCKEKMAKQVDKEYLKKELRNSVDFEKVKAETLLHNLKPGDFVVVRDRRRKSWKVKVEVAERATWIQASHCRKVPPASEEEELTE
ncbi:uncharacterized protein LOC127953236 isoform X2 [Carassius gibelio]|uniref:uncharacterized protein LOC127953236 isoform X2 n=1 Tax=Carassius gibelio TaxID=101364 RepID=UPI00227774D8|nr:uncharacterized protein LOC127953236 isoform X2 [Carassius gibelio]